MGRASCLPITAHIMALTSRQISCEESQPLPRRAFRNTAPRRFVASMNRLSSGRAHDSLRALCQPSPPSASSSSRKRPGALRPPIDFLPRRFFWSGATVTAASFNLFSLLVSRIRILILAFAGIELNLVPRPLFHGRFLRPQRRTQQYCNWHGQPQRMCQHGRARLAQIRRHHASVV